MPVQGLVPLRRRLFGRQNALGDSVPATRAYPFGGVPSVNRNWTVPGGDFGALDPVAPPVLGASENTASYTADPVNYNDLPLMLSAFFGGAVDPTGAGTAKTWNYQPASLTADDFDYFSHEFGDDVTTDWFQFVDGILDSLTIDSPEQGGGVLTADMSWRFGDVRSTGSTDYPVVGTVPVSTMVPDPTAIPIYLKDMSLYVDSTPGGLGGTQLTDALHKFTFNGTQAVDEKRYANGTQSFSPQAYGRGPREMEIVLQYAKTADTVGTGSESDAWHSDTAVDRYLRLEAISTALAEAGTPYSWTLNMPMRYFTREETNIGNNTTVTLTGRAFYEPDTLLYAIDTTVINTLAAGEFSS